MKKLLNIILFALISLACRCQTDIDETIELLTTQVKALEDELIISHQTTDSVILANTQLLTIIDSLGVSQPPGVFVGEYDTAYVYIEDQEGSIIEVRKNGSQINTMAVKGLERISAYWTDNRRVYFMNDAETGSSILEDSTGYTVNFTEEEITIRKRK